MRVLVSGTGHGGTSILAAVVRELSWRIGGGEDSKFFKYKVLPENYGSKLVAIPQYGFSEDNITRVMQHYPDLHIVFSLRHPLDTFMAKIVRGQKPSDGGDGDVKRSNIISADGTVEGALTTIAHFYNVYKEMSTRFQERVLTVRLEDLILMPEEEVRRVAKFLKVEPTQRAFEFYKYTVNRYLNRRYGAKLDKSTVNIHKKWETWHNGFFRNREHDIRKATDRLINIIQDLGYKL